MHKAHLVALASILVMGAAVGGPALHAQTLQNGTGASPAIDVVPGGRSVQGNNGTLKLRPVVSRNVGPASSVTGYPETDMGSFASALPEVEGAPTANGTGGGR